MPETAEKVELALAQGEGFLFHLDRFSGIELALQGSKRPRDVAVGNT